MDSHSATGLACDYCRLKKFKCTKERPSCIACIQNHQPCHYSGRISRTPLTRAYLTSVERRLHKVENLFTQLHPELDLEDALANSSNPARNVGSPSRPQFQDESARSATTGPETPGQESITETVPDDADGFDWSEDVDDIADGMAALAVEPKGTGYLGSTAGVFFLRSLLYQVGQTTTAANANILQSGQSPIYATGPGSPSAVAQTLSSRHSMDRLLDAYFSVYHRTYPFVHEASFRAQYHEVIPRPRSFDILLYTILALGAWCLDDNDSHLDSQLYQRALSFREDETLFERADLTFLQALILLSNLSQKLNKPNTGSNFLGLAVRMALSLGLHRELPDWDISLLNREMRRRVWWGLYMFDSGAATTFGRPILLPGKESMDVRPVLNIHDESLTARTSSVPPESIEPTLYSGMQTQNSLHVHSNYISNRLLSSTGVSPEDAMSMNRTLDAWTDSLPVYFRRDYYAAINDSSVLFARHRIWWRFWNLKIILFRHFLLARVVEQRKHSRGAALSDMEAQYQDVAVNAASNTISSISSFLENAEITRLVTWYSIFFIFHASLVIALAILGNIGSPDVPKWQDDLDKVRHVLRITFGANPLAIRCAAVLDLIIQPMLPTVNDDLWTQGAMDPSFMDFSAWPTDGADPLTFFGWSEQGPMP